jgi:hypothetical protein
MSQSQHVFYSLRLPPVTNADRTGMPLAMAGPTQGHLAVGLVAKLLRPLETVGSGTLLYAFDQFRWKANVRRSFHNGSLARLRVVEGYRYFFLLKVHVDLRDAWDSLQSLFDSDRASGAGHTRHFQGGGLGGRPDGRGEKSDYEGSGNNSFHGKLLVELLLELGLEDQ